MADPNLTPEEKLLRIIESPQETVRGLRVQRRGGQDLKVILKILKAKYGEKLKTFLNIKAANAVLIASACFATFYLVVDFLGGMPRLANVGKLESMAKRLDIGDLSLGQLDPLSIYLQEITERNIFALPEEPKEAPKVKNAGPSVEFKSLVDGLKVVGIIWSNAPQAIIEDSKEGRTYLLNRGSKVKEARVKDILKDRVILSYDDQEVELR